MTRTRHCDEGVARHNQTRSESNSDESSWRSWPRKLFEHEIWDSQNSGAGWQLFLQWSRAPWSKLEQRIDPWHADEWLVLVKAGREGVEATGARWQIVEHPRVRAGDDGTRLANVGRNSHHKFFHELTEALLHPEQARLAKIKRLSSCTRWTWKSVNPKLKAQSLSWRAGSWRTKGHAKRPDIRARFDGRGFRWNSLDMETSFAVTPQVGITEIDFVTVPNAQGGGGPSQLSRGEWQHIVLDVSRAHFRPEVDESCTYGCRLQTACQDTWENCYVHSMLASAATSLRLNKGTKLDCHHHVCTYGSDVARSSGQKQMGPAPSSAVEANTGEESASKEQPEF